MDTHLFWRHVPTPAIYQQFAVLDTMEKGVLHNPVNHLVVVVQMAVVSSTHFQLQYFSAHLRVLSHGDLRVAVGAGSRDDGVVHERNLEESDGL